MKNKPFTEEESHVEPEIINDLRLKIIELEQRVQKLEEGSSSSGVYTGGVPDYARNWYEEKKLKGGTLGVPGGGK